MIDVKSNAGEVALRLRARADRFNDPAKALDKAGQLVRDSIVERFTGNNTWAENSPYTIAQKGSSRPGIDNGLLRNSIAYRTEGDVEVVDTDVVYAKWFQNGTGIFAGHSEWTIRPKNGKSLRFMGPNGPVFARAVVMRGQPARPFMFIDDETRDRIVTMFRRYFTQSDAA